MMKLWNQEAAQWRLELRMDGEALSLRMGDAPRQMTVALGKREDLNCEILRQAAAKAVKSVRDLGGESAVLDAAPALEALGEEGLAALALGAELAGYRQPDWKQAHKEQKPFTLYVAGAPEGEKAVQEAAVLAKAVCFARDLTNCPANRLTPEIMAQRVTEAAKALGLETQIVDEKEARALGMEAFLAVGESSGNPPRLIIVRYKGGQEGARPIVLVGKGVTFDSGGYSLKQAAGMKGMNSDMAGGAAVSGAILALAENKVPVNVTAVIPAVENRISPVSFLPSDVIGSMSGKTIQIGSTDAEGRLILADAITYAIQKENAAKVVDIATLTGAMARMFGHVTTGYLSNCDAFSAQLEAAAVKSGEKFWRLPTFPEYRKMIDSPVADLYNTSDGAGAIAAGLFVGAFAGDTPWIHLDIAGTSSTSAPHKEYQAKGATGVGVTTLYELCKSMEG